MFFKTLSKHFHNECGLYNALSLNHATNHIDEEN